MRLIVGLGNPGPEYAWTPHNLGFRAVDAIAGRGRIRVERPEAKSLVGLGQFAGQEIALAKPHTMMNLSGLAVRDLLERAHDFRDLLFRRRGHTDENQIVQAFCHFSSFRCRRSRAPRHAKYPSRPRFRLAG